MASKEKYLEIRDSLCRKACPEAWLLQMKNEFRQNIESDRLFDKITTLPYLIRILEKRDCLNIANIEAFQIIGNLFNDMKINSLIERYERVEQTSPADYQRSVLGSTPVQVPRLHPVIPAKIEDPMERVHDVICSEIGKKWKDFARALGVKEGYIDSLEERYPSIYRRTQEVLTYHKQRDGSIWELCNGLDAARRKDLRYEVQKVLESTLDIGKLRK